MYGVCVLCAFVINRVCVYVHVSQPVCVCVCVYIYIYIFTKPLRHVQAVKQGNFFKVEYNRVQLIVFLLLAWLPYYLPIAGRRITGCILSPKILGLCEMPGIEVLSPGRFHSTITVTPRGPPPINVYACMSVISYVCVCLSVCMYVCMYVYIKTSTQAGFDTRSIF